LIIAEFLYRVTEDT